MTRGLLAIYHYDDNGVFRFREMLSGFPAENGDYVYHVPRNATFENPWWQSDINTGTVAVFDEKMRVWFHVPDHRGEVWFNHRDEPEAINRIGDPAAWGLRKQQRLVGAYGDG